MIYFDSADIYIESAISVKDKITRIKAVITALETSALKAAANGNISEYSLDDGQTKIKTVYRNPTEVANSIQSFKKNKLRYYTRAY